MWPTLLSLLLAADPPAPTALGAGTDELLAELGRRAAEGLSRPPGCHLLYGRGRLETRYGGFGRRVEEFRVRGVLSEGVWSARQYAPVGEGAAWEPAGWRAVSAFGGDPRVPEGVGAFPWLLDVLHGPVSLSYLEREGENWVIRSTLAGRREGRNTLTTRFDAAGQRPVSWAVRVVSPVRGLEDGGRPVRVLRLALDLTVSADGAPASEHLVGTVARGPLIGAVDHRTDWEARPCVPPSAPTTPAPSQSVP